MSIRHWAELTVHDPGPARSLVVITEQDLEAGGSFTSVLDVTGREVSRTWHGGLGAARAWVEETYGGDNVGPWQEIPDGLIDPAAFAVRAVLGGRRPGRRRRGGGPRA